MISFQWKITFEGHHSTSYDNSRVVWKSFLIFISQSVISQSMATLLNQLTNSLSPIWGWIWSLISSVKVLKSIGYLDDLCFAFQACIDDNFSMVKFLVEHGADIDACDNEGWTALHATASCGFVKIAKWEATFLVQNSVSRHQSVHLGALAVFLNIYYRSFNILKLKFQKIFSNKSWYVDIVWWKDYPLTAHHSSLGKK